MDLLGDDIDYGDVRAVEISTLRAIYPELVVDADNHYSFTLEIPVNPANAVTVAFPATGILENTQWTAPYSAAVAASEAGVSNKIISPENRSFDTHELAFLPSLSVRITLPESYPEETPPSVTVTTAPPWLPNAVVTRLENDCTRLWEEMSHDQVVFTYIDHIQLAADDCVFGLVNKNGYLAVDMKHKVSVLNYDVAAKQAAFEKETFHCGVCLGESLSLTDLYHKECGHVFCRQCLQDFYCSTITEGDLASVRCLEPNCSKERSVAAQQSGKGAGKPKMISISPGELLQIPIAEDLVRRYIDLRYKTALESDKNTVYCPRAWCNGAARSKKHRKPVGLALHESDDEPDETPDGKDKRNGTLYTDDRLAICEDCRFAFCNRCLLSWHGEFVYCSPPRKVGELAEEDKASLEYLAHHTTPCPTCAAPAQKTMGCNHMICFRCITHFCYLCSSWLDSYNPYRHFGEGPDGRRTGCFQRLWELEEGDDGDGAGHIAPFRGEAAVGVDDLGDMDSDDSQDFFSDEEEDDLSDNEAVGRMLPAAAPHQRLGRDVPARQRAARHARQPQEQRVIAGQRPYAAANAIHAPVRQADVAREGPLVLRIALGAPVPGPNDAINDVAHAPALAPRRGHGGGRGGGAIDRGNGQRAAGWRRGGNGRGRGGGEGGRGRGRNRGRGRDGPVRGRGLEAGEFVGDNDPDIEAWVRNFVGLALEDNEDGE
ncbi:hypothetical protein SEPCBS57363_004920 [Sporothrix epigloea]|uniref:RBR-type E3 ubiquitin transferase n=1 Tax=Sporothrix epigloea TaxID=1892477 RepID=A0ABP0DYL0_9PEZI